MSYIKSFRLLSPLRLSAGNSLTWNGSCVRPRPSWSLSSSFATSLHSNSLWGHLNRAVRQGNGEQAEKVIVQILSDYYQQQKNNETDAPVIDSKVFSLALDAWKHSKSPGAAPRSQQLLEQMINLSNQGVLERPPSLEDYHSVLECWAHQHRHNAGSRPSTAALFDSLLPRNNRQSNALEPTETTYQLILSICANRGAATQALTLLRDLQRSNHDPNITPTLPMYNHVLRAIRNSSEPDATSLAASLLNQMQRKENGFPLPDSESYTLVLECLSRAVRSTDWRQAKASPPDIRQLEEAARKAEELLNQMKEDRISVTAASYQSVITALAHLGEAERAESLLSQMASDYSVQFDADLKPTLEPFQSVLQAYSKSFHPEAAPRATHFLQHMKDLHDSNVLDTKPNTWSYNMVLKCWAQSNLPQAVDRALGLYDEMLSTDGIVPDVTSLNTLLNTWANAKGIDALETEEFFWKCYDKHLSNPLHHPRPDAISFGTVLKAFSRSTHPQAPDRAVALLSKLQELHEAGWERCKPDVVAYTGVIQSYARVSDKRRDAPIQAEAWLRKMQQKQQPSLEHQKGKADKSFSVAPDAICWNAAIQAWAQAGNGERAESLFREILAQYMQRKAEKPTFEKRTRHLVVPNIITFSAVLSAWAKNSRANPKAHERAEQLLVHMKRLHESGVLEESVKPNVVSYSIVLDCLANAKQRETALRAESLLREMSSSEDPDVQPNIVSYNSVLKAWSFSKDSEAVPRVTALLKEILDKYQARRDPRLRPNANSFGSVLKTLAESNLWDKEKRAMVVVSLMKKYKIPWSKWSRSQLRRCTHAYPNHMAVGKTGRKVSSNHSRDTTPLKRDLSDTPDLRCS